MIPPNSPGWIRRPPLRWPRLARCSASSGHSMPTAGSRRMAGNWRSSAHTPGLAICSSPAGAPARPRSPASWRHCWRSGMSFGRPTGVPIPTCSFALICFGARERHRSTTAWRWIAAGSAACVRRQRPGPVSSVRAPRRGRRYRWRRLLALAYPDRVAQRRPGQAGRFLLRNGLGAFTDAPALALADYLVAAELDGDRRESRIWLAAALPSRKSSPCSGIRSNSRTWSTGPNPKECSWRPGASGSAPSSFARLRSREPDAGAVAAGGPADDPAGGPRGLTWTETAPVLRERLTFGRRLAADGGTRGPPLRCGAPARRCRPGSGRGCRPSAAGPTSPGST